MKTKSNSNHPKKSHNREGDPNVSEPIYEVALGMKRQIKIFHLHIFGGCLVEEFDKCCLGIFDICVGEKMYEKMCNVV